jgi:phosphoribosyl 1,2-cyclic phosphate phosphodiesterase
MKVTVLGCGGASGVPSIAAGWGKCDPAEPRNRRRRASILVEDGESRVLVDSSPDMREQLLDAGVRALSAVIYTHEHADHLHGIDDLREINRAMGAALPIWGTQEVLDTVKARFGYTLAALEPEADIIYKPLLEPYLITGRFRVGALDILPVEQDHGYTKTTGLRFGSFAYSTDAVELSDHALAQLEGLDVWMVGCLTDAPHPTHAHVDKVLAWVERIKPRMTYLTHLGWRLDYRTLERQLPPHVRPAHDGLAIHIPQGLE